MNAPLLMHMAELPHVTREFRQRCLWIVIEGQAPLRTKVRALIMLLSGI